LSVVPVIDIHSHFLPETWPDLAARFGTPDWPWMRHTVAGKAMLMLGEKEFRPVYDACWSGDQALGPLYDQPALMLTRP
jgi:aminocarboxymuconate-semialdehyde decarboxylase